MGTKKQLDATKTTFSKNIVNVYKSFKDFKAWFDPKYKNVSAEEVWKKLGGKIA